MTANTSIITEKKDQVIKVANAALRFKMPDNIASTASNNLSANSPKAQESGVRPAGGAPGPRAKPYGAGAQRVMTRKVWVLEEKGLGKKPVQKTIRVGLTDGAMTEILVQDKTTDKANDKTNDKANNNTNDKTVASFDMLKPGTEVIIGIVGATPAPAIRPTGPRLF